MRARALVLAAIVLTWGMFPAGLARSGSSAAAADAPAAAPPGARLITVSGAGKAVGKPTIAEFSGFIAGEADLAADAVVKHRDTKRRAVKAIEDLKIASLAVKFTGFNISQATDPNMEMALRRGQTPTNVKTPVRVSEQFKLEMRDIDKLKDEDLINSILKVLDTARDAGMTIGPGSPKTYQQMINMSQNGQSGDLVTFRLPDAAALRAQAYKAAIDAARAKAEQIAQLAGAKLGKIASVQDNGPAMEPGYNSSYYRAVAAQMQQQEMELTSTTYGEMTLNVSVQVQFMLE